MNESIRTEQANQSEQPDLRRPVSHELKKSSIQEKLLTLRAYIMGERKPPVSFDIDGDDDEFDPTEELRYLINKSDSIDVYRRGVQILRDGVRSKKGTRCLNILAALALPSEDHISTDRVSIAQNALVETLSIDFDRSIDGIVWLINNSEGDVETTRGILESMLIHLAKEPYRLLESKDLVVLRKLGNLIARASEDPAIARHLSRFFEKYFALFGLNERRTFNAWYESFFTAWDNKSSFSRAEDFAEVLSKNLYALHKLYEYSPFAARDLAEEFNILSFGRYPVELLIRQHQERDNEELPYGIALMPRADNNGAFYKQGQMLIKLSEELNNHTVGLRIIESQSIVRTYGLLSKLNTRYGNNGRNKILFAVISGHGLKNSIRFGISGAKRARHLRSGILTDINQSSFLNTADTEQPPLNRIAQGGQTVSSFFIDRPSVALAACLTGQEGGIAEDLSNSYNAIVSGPKKAVSSEVISIDVAWEGNVPQVTATYPSEIGSAVYRPN